MNLSPKLQQMVLTAKSDIDQIGLGGQKVEVMAVIDCSGSMQDHYKLGRMQEVVERALALALNFDDDGRVPAVAFDNRCLALPDVTPQAVEGYVQREIVDKHDLGGGTRYAPALKSIAQRFGGVGRTIPGYCMFFTDGNCDDESQTAQVMRDLSRDPIFFQFVGVGDETFSFLKKLDTLTGRAVDNAGFTQVKDPTKISYKDLLNEFPQYIGVAKRAGVLK